MIQMIKRLQCYCPALFQACPIDALHRSSYNNCECSEPVGEVNGVTLSVYIYVKYILCQYGPAAPRAMRRHYRLIEVQMSNCNRIN